jgi:site-specific DNA recombinase
MILTRAKGHGGDYWYYFCSACEHPACDAPYLRVEDAEAAVLRHYATLRLPDGLATRIRAVLVLTLEYEEQSVRLVHEHLTKALRDLRQGREPA